MANVANTKSTGPVSKDAVSGSNTFKPKLSVPQTAMKELTNRSEDARRTIMGLRIASTGFSGSVERAMTKAPK